MAVLALVALPAAPRADAPPEDDPADRLPRATRIERVTWTTSPALTRLEFHGASIPRPADASPSAALLRLDFTATDAAAVPARLQVGTPEVLSVMSIPASLGVLPPGVSARFLVTLGHDELAWSIEAASDKVIVFIGNEEKAGGRGLVLQDPAAVTSSPLAAVTNRPSMAQVLDRPTIDEALERSLAFVVPAAQSIRASPSAVSAEVGWARAGETKLADARRGDWVHVVGGGWLRLPEGGGVEAPSSRGAAASPGRSPATWSVVTLGTGLEAQIEEILPGSPEHESLSRLLREPVRLAHLAIRVQGGQFSFQLPPKKGRVKATLRDGREIDSLDPRQMELVDERSRARVDEVFDAPALAAGDEWRTILLFPGDLDFLAIERIRLDVGGMQHSLFRVPGSGDPLDDAPRP